MRDVARHSRRQPHVLIVVENCWVPLDRRVWLECTALVEAGYEVSVIAQRGPEDTSRYGEIDGVRVYRFTPPEKHDSTRSFLSAYVVAWLKVLGLAVRVWRRSPFDVIQACNPPDSYFLLARLFRPLGVRFLFDQHEPCPELYAVRFAQPSRLVGASLTTLERLTHRAADHVITVNDSCRELLLRRDATPPGKLTVVRTGPDTARLKPVPPREDLKHGRRFLCCYIGVMGPQDGVDLLVRVAHVLVHDRGRTDVHFGLMGYGTCLADLRQLAAELAVEDYVTFTGTAGDQTISEYMSTADIGLQPDLSNDFNQLCSMAKTVEYMMFGLPMVSFGLTETRRTAGDAALYVQRETPERFADAIEELLGSPDARTTMGAIGRDRVDGILSWERQKPIYLNVVAQLCGTAAPERADGTTSVARSAGRAARRAPG
jgi:glycosyltransferase involved in cell wall biosynthesis